VKTPHSALADSSKIAQSRTEPRQKHGSAARFFCCEVCERSRSCGVDCGSCDPEPDHGSDDQPDWFVFPGSPAYRRTKRPA
jgi:hypothetical protein